MKSTAEIVYEQAVRAVDQQVAQLDELRTRSAVVLAAAGVLTGFLARAATEKGVGAFGYLAMGAFVVCALAAIWVLLPSWKKWEFSINAKSLMPYFLSKTRPKSPDELFEYLANQIEDDYAVNEKELARLYSGFTWACVALAVEVILWFLDRL